MSEAEASSYVREYLSVRAAIGKLDTLAEGLRERVIEALGPDGAAPGKVWTFDGIGTVSVVRGRVSEKLDRGRLARAGIAAEVLDAATVRTEGKPSMRINALEATTNAP